MKFLDPNDPFFAKPWVRWATVVAPITWGLVELFWTESAIWGALFIGVGVYAFWALFLHRRDG